MDCGPRSLSADDVSYVSQLIKQAGALAVDMRSQVTARQKSGPRDLVTEADEALSKLIVAGLQKRFPDDSVVSEEDAAPQSVLTGERIWLVDPIDGTEYYVSARGMYCVMIGLLVDGKPTYGWVYNPCVDVLYVAEPLKQVKKLAGDSQLELPHVCLSLNNKRLRLMMGNRDREQHPWSGHVLRGTEWIDSGSIGLCVARILEGSGDVYVHLAGKLKAWDSAAPAAMALAAGLEVGSLGFDGLPYAGNGVSHEFPVVIGRRGSLAWARNNLKNESAPPFVPAPQAVPNHNMGTPG
jgi:3'(2'), 5'-bisphosphate nucleotidase